jgi:hypothetical protein
MRARKLRYGQAVRVIWEDSSTASGWIYKNPKAIGEPTRVVSMGFVVNSRQDSITLTTSIDAEAGNLSPVTIPWSAVQRVDVLEKKWMRGREDEQEHET